MPRLPLFALALLLGACGDATPAPQTRAAIAPTAAETDDRSADGAPAASVAEDTGANADASDTPPAASAPSAARPSPASAPDVPIVQVEVHASVQHAASGATQLTLRSGPSTSSENLGTFSEASVLECQDLPRDDAWCWILAETADRGTADRGEVKGWAKRRHLSYVGNIMEEEDGVRMFGDPGVWGAADGFPVSARWDILADDGYANVRARPDAGSEVVRRLDNRVMTDVVRCGPGEPGRRWCEISAPVQGWVHQSGFHRDLRSY